MFISTSTDGLLAAAQNHKYIAIKNIFGELKKHIR